MSAVDEREDFDELFSLVYEELRQLAANVLRSERNGQLTPTTLVHETWLKLAPSPQLAHTSPLHFRRIAARAMRQVLVEAARRRDALRRGSGETAVTFDEFLPGLHSLSAPKDILALDSALYTLGQLSERQVLLVEGRFFGGLEVGELATLYNVSESTVTREWRSARAWLAAEIRRSLAGRATVVGTHANSEKNMLP